MFLDKAFWDQEDLRLYTDTERIIIQLFLRGVFDAETDLKSSGAGQLIDWDTVSMDAIRYLQTVHKDIVHMINETTQQRVYPLIEDWMRSGEPLPKLIKSIEEAGIPKHRARRIGVTEVTRAFNSGKLKAWQSTGYITTKQWATAKDERVCPVCRALDGKISGIDANFYLTGEDARGDEDPLLKLLSKGGGELTYMTPPAHPNCRCGLRPIVDLDVIRNTPVVNLD